MATILIVDDEAHMLELIEYNLARLGHEVTRAESAKEGLAQLDSLTPDLIISDIMMPGLDGRFSREAGFDFCEEVRRRKPTMLTPFLFLTAKADPTDQRRGYQVRADAYVTKPADFDVLLAQVEAQLAKATEARRIFSEEIADVQTDSGNADKAVIARSRAGFEGFADLATMRAKIGAWEEQWPAFAELRNGQLVGEDPVFIRALFEVMRAAQGPDPVLIIGESGTGKSALARAVGAWGNAERPWEKFYASDFAGADPLVAAGKLFGYGSGSGLANVPADGVPGIFERADGGVLFLDEVADLHGDVQNKLLGPLDGEPFHPAAGEQSSKTVNVKLVLATDRDLERATEDGTFRKALLRRIWTGRIRMPALRDRASDIEALARHFLGEVAEQTAGSTPMTIDGAALDAMRSYGWPGNVGELRAAIRAAFRAAHTDDRTEILRADLPEELRTTGSRAATAVAASTDSGGIAWTRLEQQELTVLRDNEFQIGPSEDALNYSRQSKSLTKHLKGMRFKALAFTDLDPERAAELLTGANPQLAQKQTREIRKLLDRLQKKLNEAPDSLFKDLLREHRDHALSVLERLRKA